MFLYGNCQAEFIRDMLRADPLASSLFRFVYVCSYSNEREPFPSSQDFSDCAILCEQVDSKEFPHRSLLPSDCKRLSFPSLDSVLLWPLTCVNPYNVPEFPQFPYGRFLRGDRIILREIDRDMAAGQVLSYYLNGWNDYKINLKRVAELERVRLSKREAGCDVVVADLVLQKLGTEQLFWNTAHPKRPLLAALMERLIDACSRYEPLLQNIDAWHLIEQHPEIGKELSEFAVPVHPQIANELELEWYDPKATYQQLGGYTYSYDQYFDELIRYSIANKRKLLNGEVMARQSNWDLPIDGAASASDVTGYFSDGFMGKMLRFRLTAESSISGLQLKAFCPAHHTGPLRVQLSTEGVQPVAVDVNPGAMVTINLDTPLTAGHSAKFTVVSSAVMNLLARGESEDARDLSILILAVHTLA